MGTLYFKVAADWEEVQRLRTEIDNLKSSLQNINSQTPQQVVSDLETKLKSCVEQYRAITSEAAKAGAMIENEFKKSVESLDLKNPTAQLRAFDSELMKMVDNLSGYFDSLQSKLQGMSDVLGGGKTIAGNIAVNQDNVAQIEQMKQQNEELTSQIKQQQEEIQKQKQAWDELAQAVKTNNIPAIQQLSQSTQQVDLGDLKSKAKELTADMKEQEQVIESLKMQYREVVAQVANYNNIISGRKLGNTTDAILNIDSAKQKEQELKDKLTDQKGILEEQKQKYEEINQQISQGASSHVRMRTQIMNAREELIKMQMAGQGGTLEFMKMAENAGMLRRQMMLANATMQYYANPTRHLAGLKTAFQGAAGAASLLTGVMGIFNTNSEKMAAIQTKIQSYLGIIVGLETTYNTIKKTSAAMLLVQEIQTKALARAEAAELAMKEGGTVATIKATVAHAAFNTVAKMNPYLLMIGAITTIVGGIWLLTKAINGQSEAQKEANRRAKEYWDLQNKLSDQAAAKAADQITLYEKLKRTWENLGSSQKAQKKFIDDNQSAFQSLGVSISSVNDANNYLVRHSGDVVKALMAQAGAAAAFDMAKDIQKKYIQTYRTKTKKIDISDIPTTVWKSAGGAGSYKVDLTDTQRRAMQIELQNKENEKANTANWKQRQELKKQMDFVNNIVDNGNKVSDSIYKKDGIKQYQSNTGKSTEKDKHAKVDKTDLEKQQREYEALLAKQKYDEEKYLSDLEKEVSTSQIKAMKEGSDKKIAQINTDFENEMATIEQKQKEEEKKLTDEAEKAFYKNPGRKKGSKFNPLNDESLRSTLSTSSKYYFTLMENAQKSYNNKIDEQKQSEADSLNEYLQKYGTYEEKKLAITKLYQAKIDKASTEGERMSLGKEMQETLSTLDFSELKKKMNWEVIFGNIQNASKKMLQEIKKQLKAFINSPEFQELKPTDQKTVIEGYQKVNSSLIGKSNVFSGLVESVKGLKESSERFKQASLLYEIMKNNPEAYSSEQIENARLKKNSTYSEYLNSKGDVDQTVTQIATLSNSIAKLGSSSKMSVSELGQVTADISKAFGKAAGKIGGIIGAILQLVDAIGKQGLDKFLGNILSSVSNAVGGVLSTVGNIFTGYAFHLGGADYTSYEEMKVKYQSLSKVWDELISKKQKYLKESYGTEVIKTEKEIQDLLQNELESYKALGLERLKAGASTGSHSIGVRQFNNMDSQSLSELVKYYNISVPQGDNISTMRDQKAQLRKIFGDRMENLFGMSADELEKLKENATTFWATMDSDVRTYLENIIKAKEEAKDAMDAMKERLLGTSLDSFKEGWESMLEDLSSDNDSFADDFEKKLIKTVISGRLMSKYKSEIESLYDEWYKAAESGGISVAESDYLQQQTSNLSQQMIEERTALMNAFGWSSTGSSSGTVGVSNTMSQDTGNAIEGRMTAIEELAVERNSILNIGINDIKAAMAQGSAIVDENRTHLVNIYSELQGIHGDTTQANKYLKSMDNNLNEVRNNTKNLK